MKKIITLSLIVFGLLFVTQTYAQQGIGTDLPHKSAALHIESGKRGLLIPRFVIPDLNAAAPVTLPANGLLVFNEGNGTDEPGFYWWSLTVGKWIAVSQEQDAITVSSGSPDVIEVDLTGTNYEVSVKPGLEGQLLVTVDNGNGLEANWVDFDEIFKIDAKNGLTLNTSDPDETVVELGGPLTRETEIDTDGFDFSIKGLEDISSDVQGGTIDLDDYQFLIMDSNGILHRIDYQDILPDAIDGENLLLDVDFLEFLDGTTGEGAVLAETKIGIKKGTADGQVLTTVDDGNGLELQWKALAETENPDAKNGLHYDDTLDEYHLGGKLKHDTVIETGGQSEGGNIANTLAITGLDEVNTDEHKIIVSQNVGGVLRTVSREIHQPISGNTSVDGLGGYSPYVQQIYITTTTNDIDSGDITLTLPDAANAKGQVINVRINGNAEPNNDNYLYIEDASGPITLGAMPTQGWVFKSDGTNWNIVAKN